MICVSCFQCACTCTGQVIVRQHDLANLFKEDAYNYQMKETFDAEYKYHLMRPKSVRQFWHVTKSRPGISSVGHLERWW